MAARDKMAAAVIVLGIASVSTGAFLISASAGFVVLGALLSALGVGLGFGEREPEFLTAEEEAGIGTVHPAESLGLVPPPPAESVAQPVAEPPADLTVSRVPLAKYLGRTGEPEPVTVPQLPPGNPAA